ncbi:sperm-associated microtubule inner protein 4-like [Clytia hemisphaerica]|uniref:Uncharacterized protein n=1 Tax=Clytia hemisphaerica TaxID=252671 RepID=A0A7M5UZZ0_9CNID|eukprot:TCONS_00024178-protein
MSVASYDRTHPSNYLSKTFESNVLFSPGQTGRRTISNENYVRQVAKDFYQPPTPWGRKNSYGARNFIHLKGTPNGNDMVIVAKGSKHFGSGITSKPRGVVIQEQYQITPYIKNKLRPDDELIPASTKVDLTSHQVDHKYPIDHPYTSHIPKNDLLPSSTPDEDAVSLQDENYIHPADSPASAPQPYIHSKTRGAPYRHELIDIPLDSKRKPTTWPQAQNLQSIRGPGCQRNVYYPTPRTQLDSSLTQPQPERPVSKETLKTLKDVNKSMMQSIYQKDFVGERNEKPKTLENDEILNTFKDMEIQSYSGVPSHVADAIASNKNENTLMGSSDEPRFKRPMYKGVRPYTTVGIFKETSPSAVSQSELAKSKPNQSERAKTAHLATNQYHKSEDEPLVPFERTEYQRTYNSKYPEREVPDLRATWDVRKPLLEKRHFVPIGERKLYIQR